MRRPFTLVDKPVSSDTVIFLREMLALAEKGECLGVGFIGMLKERRYITNVTGEVQRNPTWGLGMLRVLDHELCRQVVD